MGKGWHLHMGRELLLKTSVKHHCGRTQGVQEIQIKFWVSFLSLEPLECMPFFSPQAIFLQLVHVTDPHQRLLHGQSMPAGLRRAVPDKLPAASALTPALLPEGKTF